jgi:DNA-binding SARP family transcriptional activator/TolB-like protein
MAVPTYRLETFGKLALSGGATGSLSHQRRRLALLALLAASGERGLSRDQLLGFLWPESTAANARHSLEQLVHAIRRALGENVFVGVNPLRLNPDFVASDVDEFEKAMSREALADAVALYKGPFLSGFYLEDGPEFERWADGERSRLSDRYVKALDRLARDAELANDHAAAIAWRRRLVEADPVSSRFALAFMKTLAASGDRGAALQYARVHESLVMQELEIAPDPSITAYVAALRAGEVTESPRPSLVNRTALPVDSTTSSPVNELVAPVRSGDPPTEMVSQPATQGRTATNPGRLKYLLVAASATAIVTIVLFAATGRNGEKAPALDSNKIVIVPFRTQGADSSVKYLGEGVVDLIAPMLTGEGGPVAVDSRTAISTWNRITNGRDGTAADARQVAQELGAGLVLSGAIVEVGGKLTITGNVISGTGGDSRPLISVTAPIDSVDTLLDRFVGQLLTRHSGVPDASVASITSQSLPAIRAYLNGRAAYRRADEEEAIASFNRALEIDSTFALAGLDLAVATGKLVRGQICRNEGCRVYSIMPGLVYSERTDDLFDRAVHVAWANRQKLGRRDLPLLEALRGHDHPRISSARETLAGLDRAVQAAPDRPETHYLIGTLLLHQGFALGVADSRQRAEAAFRKASQLDSGYLAPLARMVDVAVFARDTPAIRRAGQQYLARDSVRPRADYVRWLLAVGAADRVAHKTTQARLHSLSDGVLDQIYLMSQMTGFALEDADSATRILIGRATEPVERAFALRRGQMLALNLGRPSEATRLMRRMDDNASSFHFPQFAISAAMTDDGDRALADSLARVLAARVARDTVGTMSTDAKRRASVALSTISFWYMERGDSNRAAAATNWLRRHLEGQPRNSVLSVQAEMVTASRGRRPEGAKLRAFVDSMALEGCCEFPPNGSLLLARAYEESGDRASALRVLRRGFWYYPPRHIAVYLREEGRIAALLGDRSGAIRAYEHYLALRSNPEPALRPERDRIRAELNRLKRGR